MTEFSSDLTSTFHAATLYIPPVSAGGTVMKHESFITEVDDEDNGKLADIIENAASKLHFKLPQNSQKADGDDLGKCAAFAIRRL